MTNLGNMPYANHILRQIVERLNREYNMPTGDYLPPNQERRGGRNPLIRLSTRARIEAAELLSRTVDTPVIIHEPITHYNYFRADVSNNGSIRAWIMATKELLGLNGLNYVLGSNYFFNLKCCIYVFDGSQSVIYTEDGEQYEWANRNESIHSLVGFLTMNHLIESSFIRTAEEALEGLSSDIPTPPPPRDPSDRYEF